MKKTGRRKSLVRLETASLLGLALVLTSCLGALIEKPSITLREVTLRPHSLSDMNLVLGLDVQNLNRFDLRLTSFDYKVYLNDQEVGSGRLEKEILVPASSTSRVQVPILASFKDLGGPLKAVITGEEMPYRIEGKAGIKTFIGSLTYSFSKEGRINLKV